MALVRLFNFVSGTLIREEQVDPEFNQIVDLLSGVSTNVDTILRLNSGSLPVLRLDQLGAAPIIIGRQNTTEVFRVLADGKVFTATIIDVNGNEQIILTSTASAVNEITVTNAATGGRPKIAASGGDTNIDLELLGKGTGRVRLNAADPTADDHATRKIYVDSKKVAFSVGFFIPDPATANINTRDFGTFIVPNPGNFTFTKAKIVYKEGSHTIGGSITFKIEQVFVGDKATLTLDNTNNTINTIYEDNFGDFTLNENNFICCYISARSGTITEKDVMVVIEGYRTLF